ncbi:MAG: oxidoreductase [bacterium]
MPKKKIAFYWASACGGCEVAVLDIDENILKVAENADIYMWPVAMDFKEKDVESLEDGFLDVVFFNGAIRNSHEEHMAHLLRKKTKLMVAFGACACFGGIPGLANFYNINDVLKYAYNDALTNDNPNSVIPNPVSNVDEGEVHIPKMFNRVMALNQVVDVDYYIPGCPPAPTQITDAVLTLLTGDLPEKGYVFAGTKTLCDTCEREKEEKKLPRFKRLHLTPPAEVDQKKCFLEQGIICLGPITRSGCGNRCINAQMPCRGCFGPSPYVSDMGAKFVSALGSVEDADMEERAQGLADEFLDPAGTLYRFCLPISLLKGNIRTEEVD